MKSLEQQLGEYLENFADTTEVDLGSVEGMLAVWADRETERSQAEKVVARITVTLRSGDSVSSIELGDGTRR